MPERLERGQRRADLGAEQHGAGGLHGDVDDDRQVAAGVRPAPAWRRSWPPWSAAGPGRSRSAPRRCRRRACPRPAPGRRRAAVAKLTWPRVGSLVPGPDGAEHAARAVGGGVRVGGLAGDPGAAADSSKIRSAMPYSPSAARLAPKVLVSTAVHAGLEVGVVDGADDVGPGDVEDLVAALEPVEVVQGQVVALQHRAHRPVRDHHALRQDRSKLMRHLREDSSAGRRAGVITTM